MSSSYFWAMLLYYFVFCSLAEEIGKSSTIQQVGKTYALALSPVPSFSRKYRSLIEHGFLEEAHIFSAFHAGSMFITLMFLLGIISIAGVSHLTMSHIRGYGTKTKSFRNHLVFSLIGFLGLFFVGDIDLEQSRTFGRFWYHISPWYMYLEVAQFVCLFLLVLHFVGLVGVRYAQKERSRGSG